MSDKPTAADVGALFLNEAPAEEVVEQPVEAPAEEPVEEISLEQAEEEGEVVESPENEALAEHAANFVEVEYDGRLYEVPVELKDALMKSADYTQKSQANALAAKQFDAITAQAQQAVQGQQFLESVFDERLQASQLEANANQYKDFLRDNIDSLTTAEITKIQLQIQDAQDKHSEIMDSLGKKQQEFQQAQQQSHQELLNKGTEILMQSIPTWGEQEQTKVREYAMSAGFAEAEIQGVVDPRQVLTLWKAAQYDALQAGKATAVQKVQNAPKIQPKSRNPMPKETQDALNLRKKLKSNNLSAREKQSLAAEAIGKRWG
ncbi:MAG: hypothetical protein AAGE92_00015 [Cyanobacteria bacterium P01_G01_bin.4]